MQCVTSGRPSSYLRDLSLWRVVLLGALFLGEFELVEVWLRNHFVKSTALASVWAPLFDYRHFFFSFIVIFPAALLLLIWPRFRLHLSELRKVISRHSWGAYLVAQLIIFACFLLLTYFLSIKAEIFAGFTSPSLALWATLCLSTAAGALLTLAPANYWQALFKREQAAMALSAVTALLVTGFFLWLQGFTSTLARGAMYGSSILLRLLYEHPTLDTANRLIGTDDFVVQVSNACAGYEGITLIAVFLSLYLWLYRKELRFPQVLIAYPIGFCVMWVFNVLRITTLIAIGDAISPQIALAGFHSNAGWISFLAVAIGLAWALHKAPFFTRTAQIATTHSPLPGARPQASQHPAPGVVDALLIPFVVLMASILLIGAITAGFDSFYPVKVIATGFTLWYFRDIYNFSEYRISFEAISAGVLVFVIWIILVPDLPGANQVFATRLEQWPLALTCTWIAFRIIGSVITVPLAEELAFRGYLLARLGGQLPAINSDLRFSLLAFIISSLLFGLMHGDWTAGILAGMAYAWARYRRGQLGDAIIAHMTTNLLLSLYVLSTQQWSYW